MTKYQKHVFDCFPVDTWVEHYQVWLKYYRRYQTNNGFYISFNWLIKMNLIEVQVIAGNLMYRRRTNEEIILLYTYKP